MTMKKVNVFEVKAKLSEYLDMAEQGEQVVICRRNRPVAELRAVGIKRSTERPLGGMRLELPQAFFEPLPADIEDAFNRQAIGGLASTAAERADKPYAPSGRTKRRKKS